MVRPKTQTADVIIGAAERHFAERGYEAASMGDIAREVGIRTPSLYSHFKNKRALYDAVFERRLQPLFELLGEIGAFPQDQAQALQLLQTVMRHYMDDPQLARLVQYAVLAGGEQLEILMARVYRPLFLLLNTQLDAAARLDGLDQDEARMLVVAFNSLVFGYVNFAPVYAELLNGDPLSSPAADRYIALLETLVKAVRGGQGSDPISHSPAT